MAAVFRRAPSISVLLLGIVAASAVPTTAQSLGEAARAAKEGRAKSAKPARVYTDDDLEAKRAARPDRDPASPIPPDAARAQPAGKETPSGAESAEDGAAQRKRQEAAWRVRFADARRKVAEAELRCWHSVVRTVFVAGIPVQQWLKEFEESEELRSAKTGLADLEEEFRQTGLPPGWARG
jgi:hypothetical protein